MANDLFRFQGYVYLGDTGAQKIKNPFWVGNALLSVSLSTDTETLAESFSGNSMPYGLLQKSKSAEIKLTLYEAKPENLALALYGDTLTVAAGTVTDEAFTATAGDVIALDHPMISGLTLTDSAASPATLTEGVDYELTNASGGLITLIDDTGFTAPFLASYSHAKLTDALMFTTNPPERWVQMLGVNTLNNTPVVVDLYRVRFNPASELNLHNDSFGTFELSGSCLVDASLIANASMGGFGRIRLPG